MLMSEEDEKIIEKAIYLPLLIINLNRDLKVIEQSDLKIKEPYLILVEDTLKKVQMDYASTKRYMFKNGIKVERLGTEGVFTEYLVANKGFKVNKNFFNPVLKQRTKEFFEEYMLNKSDPPSKP